MNPLPPYDLEAIDPAGNSAMLIFRNTAGISIFNNPFPVYIGSRYFANRRFIEGIGQGDSYPITIEGLSSSELDMYYAYFEEFSAVMEEIFPELIGGGTVDWDNSLNNFQNWNRFSDVKNSLSEKRAELWQLYTELNQNLGIEFFKSYDDPDLLMDKGFLMAIDNSKYTYLRGDEKCFPREVIFEGSDDFGYEKTLRYNDMAKFGYRFVGARREDGRIINIGEEFTIEKDGEILTPIFEPLTGKGHGGVIMTF